MMPGRFFLSRFLGGAEVHAASGTVLITILARVLTKLRRTCATVTTKIGIIRCDTHSADCAGFHCFPALRDKTGQFERYDAVDLVGFDTCGGCDRGKSDRILSKAERLKDKGADVIHIGNCMSRCPVNELYVKDIAEKVHIDVVRGTH
jgi:predicted metal-binding protein